MSNRTLVSEWVSDRQAQTDTEEIEISFNTLSIVDKLSKKHLKKCTHKIEYTILSLLSYLMFLSWFFDFVISPSQYLLMYSTSLSISISFSFRHSNTRHSIFHLILLFDSNICLFSNVHTGNIILENLLGDAFLTDFTHSKEMSPTIMTSEFGGGNDNNSICNGKEHSASLNGSHYCWGHFFRVSEIR